MGKKKQQREEDEEEEKGQLEQQEGKNLLGCPSFKELENGRLKCLETGHEIPPHAKDSYAHTKHCRLGLIDSALSQNKPPLNMFRQDPLSRSKLICKLTGDTINKSEEHIWKHISGRRFLNMLEKKEAEKQTPSEIIAEQTPDSLSKPKADGLKKKKNKKQQEKNVQEVISQVRNSSDKDSDSEEADLWMPPVGFTSESDPETEDANRAEDGTNDARKLSKRTKRMSIEIGPSSFASRKKKKKTKST